MRAAEVWKRCPLALRDTLPAWVLARVIVLASLGAARFVIDEYPRSALARNAQVTLIGWDAGIYNTIARFGYAADPETYRFFPLYPLASRALNVVTPGTTKVALVILANLCALGFAVLVHRLVMHETGDAETARRAAWFACIAPPAFVMVWGYAEPMFLLLSVATLPDASDQPLRRGRALRRPGRTHPSARDCDRDTGGDRSRGAASAPRASAAASSVSSRSWPLRSPHSCSCVWVRDRTGDLLDPYRIQAESTHRGRTVDPFTGVCERALRVLRPRSDRAVAPRRVGRHRDRARRGDVPTAAGVVRAVRRGDAGGRALVAQPRLVRAVRVQRVPARHRRRAVVRNRRLETLVFTAMGAAMCLYGFVAAFGVYVP